MDELLRYALTTSQYVLIVLSAAIIIRCLRSMLSEGYEEETWAYIHRGSVRMPVTHWENIIGRSASADIQITNSSINKVHAVLVRSDKGVWRIFDVFSRGGVWVNGQKTPAVGSVVEDGDVINVAGVTLKFSVVSTERRQSLEKKRTSAGGRVSPLLTLIELTVLQLFLLVQHTISAEERYLAEIALAFAVLILLQWVCYYSMRIINRSGFETEILAFYLTTFGLSVAASSVPENMFKQIVLIIASVLMFLLCGWWMRNLRRTAAMRLPAAIAVIALLALNLLTSEEIMGARNWMTLWGYSFQPSELVKVAYIYVGASTLDRLYRKKNLFIYIIFSAICVMALAAMGDFGTALVFFIAFLVISFMRSGSLATVLLAVSGAGLAGFLAVSVKPYIAQRFASWGHVWEDAYNTGFQQTRAMSAAAGGGLIGKGAGAGWLKTVVAADTDMVFGMICEEEGLIVAIFTVLAVLALALFAVRAARRGRSAFYAIAACASVTMLLVQLSLNVFGSMDILPFTGVTFPFVSRGGTSLLSCWMLMAFIKGADTRRDASFVVRPIKGDTEAEK